MAATKTGYAYISACRQDGSEILTAISMFSESSYPMRSTGMLHDQTGSEKSNMAACKQEVYTHISPCRRDRNEILTDISMFPRID